MSYAEVPVARALPFCQAQEFDGERYHRCGEYDRPGDHDIHRCECSHLWAERTSRDSARDE